MFKFSFWNKITFWKEIRLATFWEIKIASRKKLVTLNAPEQSTNSIIFKLVLPTLKRNRLSNRFKFETKKRKTSLTSTSCQTLVDKKRHILTTWLLELQFKTTNCVYSMQSWSQMMMDDLPFLVLPLLFQSFVLPACMPLTTSKECHESSMGNFHVCTYLI